MIKTKDDDFDLPRPLDKLPEDAHWFEGRITDTSELQDRENSVTIKKEDFDKYELDDVQTTVAVAELADCDMYLKNLHKTFKYVNSINSVLKVVGGCIGVHRHRREVLKELKANKSSSGNAYEVDDQGNLVPVKKS